MMAETQGYYFDANVADQRPVTIALDPDGLTFWGAGQPRTTWTLRSIRAVEPAGSPLPLRFAHTAVHGSRLIVTEEWFATLLWERHRHLWPNRSRGRLARPAGWLIGTFGAIALLGYLTLQFTPDVLARYMPEQWRSTLGGWSEQSLTGTARQCASPAGDTAIAELTRRFMEAEPDLPRLTIKVFDLEMVNAFAVPGDIIILTRGLLERAGTADELAGVLAHEIGHAVHRHPEAQLVRVVGLQLLLGLLTGGSDGGTLAGTAAVLRYSRDAETEADEFGLTLLIKSSIDPLGLTRFFELVLREEQAAPSGGWGWDTLLSTHPDTQGRIQQIGPLPAGIVATPALTADQWSNFKAVCG